MSNQPPKTTQPPAGLDVNTILKKKIEQSGPGGMQDPTYEPGFNIRATPTYRPLKALPMGQTPIQPSQAATDFITDWRENAYKQQFTNGQINGTKVTGPGGEALPYGAKAWDWFGSPYYGEGFWGWANKLQSKLYAPSTVASLTPDELKSISVGFSPPTDDPKAMALLKKGGYIPESFANGDPKFWESMYGMARFKMDQSWNYGATAAGTDRPVLSRLPGVVGEGVMDAMDYGLQEITRLVTASIGTKVDFFSGKIKDFNDLQKTYGAYHAAGDVGPTALWDYASSLVAEGDPKSQAMAEYKRRYLAGEDPNLLAAELSNPWAEGIFDLAAGFGLPIVGWMDPLNWLGDMGKIAKTGKALEGLQDVAKLSPEMAGALKAASNAGTELDGLQAMDNVINTIAKEVQNGADEIEAAAKEIGLFAPTASSKRFQAVLRQGTLMKWVATSVGKTQGAVDVIEGMYKMGRGAELMRGATDAEVIKMARTLIGEGLNQVTNIMPYADPLLGKAGAETSAVLYKILGDNPSKFLEKTLKEAEGGMQNFIQYIGKTMEANEAKIFPTLTERIKAGEKFNPGIVAIDKFHNAAQKVVGRVNSAFAKVYMGLNPAFASRNMISNLTGVMMDQGPEAVFSMDWGWGKFLEKTLGYQPGVYGVDVKSIATGEATKQATTLWEKLKGADFTTLSNWFEKLSSQMVVTQSVKNTFKLALKEGVAIPSIKPLIDAGISQQTALQIVRLLTKYDGNVDAAMQAFRAGQKLGYIDLLSTLGHIDPKDMDLLTQLPGDAKAALIDIYQRAKTEGWTKERTMAEINLLKEKIKDLGRVDIPQGVQVTDEFGNPTVAGEVASDMGAALRGQDYEKASSTVESYVTANDNTMSSQRYVAERLVDKLQANPAAPQDMVETVKKIADGSLKEGVHQQYNSMRFFAHSTSQASYTDGFMASQEAANAWRMMGMDGAPPLDAKEFRRILWEEYYFPNVRDLYDNLIDVQQTALQNAVKFVELEPNFQPKLKELAENYTLSAAWRRVAADYSDYRQYYTALRRGQLRSANLILSNRFNAAYMDVLGTTAGTTTDRFVLDIINRYKPKAPDGTEYAPFTDLNAVDPEKITRPALSRWLRENMRTAQAAPEAVRTAETVAQSTPDVIQGAENVAQAVEPGAQVDPALIDAFTKLKTRGKLIDTSEEYMAIIDDINASITVRISSDDAIRLANGEAMSYEELSAKYGDGIGEFTLSIPESFYADEGGFGKKFTVDDILALYPDTPGSIGYLIRPSRRATAGTQSAAQAVATTARQHRAVNTEKVAEIIDSMVMRGDFKNLPDDIKTGMSEELNRIRTQMNTTEGPGKVFIYREDSATPEVRGYKSGRPVWYGERGMNVDKMSYRGEDGAGGVVKLIDDILAGNPPPHQDTMLVKTILGLAYDSFSNPSASSNVMDMVAGNNRFSAELSRIVQQINSAKSPDEIVSISDEIESLRSSLTQYATDIYGADQNAIDITAEHWDSVLNMAVEDLLNKKFPAPLPESNFVGTGNAAQDFARAMGQAYNLDADQTDQIMRINDAVANTWAAITDRPVEEWYPLRIAEIKKGGVVPEGALKQDITDMFYSLAERAVQSIPQDKMTVEQLAAALKKAGVKDDEMKWSGLKAFIDENAGGKVTKQQVAQILAENRITIEETLLAHSSPNPDDVDFWNTTPDGNVWFSRPGIDRIELINGKYVVESQYIPGSSWKGVAYDTLEEAQNAIKEAMGKSYIPDAKGTPIYGGYTVPGKKEYRELLIRMPGDSVKYRSPHFKEPNILTHVRFDTRTDADTGEVVLFIEEIQSDWHQLARKEKAVPEAPFSKSWPELAMKRIIEWAAENGFDRIAWTTGDMQISRYPGMESGEGMKGFYDQILPAMTNKYIKKWGGSVKNVEIFDVGTVHGFDVTDAMKNDVMQGQPLFQRGAKSKVLGATSFAEDGRAIMQGFKNANVSTALHELAHVYRRNLYSTLAEITNESERVLLQNDIRTVENWLKIKNGVWETKHEEKFARAFEKYLRDGETSVPSLKRIFEKFKDWLKRIYTSITGTKLDMEIPAEVKAVFDNMMIEGPRPLAPVGDGATLMPNMQVRGGFDSIDELFSRIGGNTDRAWSQVVPMDGTTPEAAAALKQWETQAKKNISQLKLFAAKRAEADRSFTLLDYADKKGIDLALAYVFPYQFWYSRTYANWMKRIVSNPVILANYMRYKDMLAKAHAGAPEWWKYNLNTNELMGRNDESPLFFNLEQTLNPLNGIAGQDFTSPYAKLTWYTQMVDSLGKYGPSTWTPFSWAMAVALANEAGKGEHINPETGLPVDYETAARYYAGKLLPQSTTVKNALTLAGIEGKWGGQSGINEVDPMALLFQGGMDYYERRRAGRAAAQVVGSGQYSDAKVLEDFQKQSGPAWDAAVKASILARAGNWTQTLLPFIFGVGFKARTASDIQIDRFDQEYRATWAMAATLSPDELRTRLSALKEKYPWSDAVLLSRKTGMERDRSYAYNVLSRIPPGASTRVWEAAGLRPEIAEQFYAAKGNLSTMSEGDRTDFMQAVVALGAILDLPNPATRQEWDAAKTAYADMQTQTKAMFGPSIMADIDFFYNGLKTQDERDAFLAANPEVEAAMNFQAQQKQTNPQLRDFYASFETIEKYYKGLMFDSLRQQFGDLGPLWDQYNAEALKGNKFKQAFWDANPILAQYTKIKAANELAITKAIQAAGSRLNTIPLVIRQDASPQTVRQQDVMNLATSAPEQTVYQMTWPELQALMSPPLARLVEDYAMRGQELPYAAQQQLERVSTKFGISPDQFMVLVEQALSVANP